MTGRREMGKTNDTTKDNVYASFFQNIQCESIIYVHQHIDNMNISSVIKMAKTK